MQALIHRIRTSLLYATALVVPWFFLPLTQEYFLTQKLYLLLGTVLVSLVVIALSLLVNKKISLIKTSFDKILFFFAFSQIVSVLFSSTNKFQALTVVPWGLGMILVSISFYFLVVNTFTKNKESNIFFQLFGIGAIIAALCTIIFWFEPLKNAQLPLHLDFLKNMYFSPIGNVMDTLIWTGLLAVMSLTGVAHSIMNSKKPSALPVIGMLIGTIAVLLVGYRAFFPPTGQQGLQLPPVESSWVASVETMKSFRTAVVGVGIDNYEVAFTAAKPRSYNTSEFWQINFNLASSMLLHIWTESGLLGLIAYLILWVYIIREIHGLFAEKDSERVSYALWAGYLGLITLILPASFITLLLTMVLCAGLALKSQSYNDEKISLDLHTLPLLYIGIALILVVVAGGVGFLAYRAYAAEFYFKASIDGIRANNGEKVYNNLVKAIRTNPFPERYHVQFSQVNLLLANNIAKKEKLTDTERQDVARFIQIAISEAKIPVQLNPGKVGYWNNLAIIYRNIINVAEGAESWTIAAYRRAILQDPNNPLIRLNLGGVYYSLKDYVEAEKLFETSAALKPDWGNAFYNLSWAQYQNKKYDAAITNLENVLKTLDKNSQDYKKAQENLEAFKAAAENTKKNAATDSAGIRQGNNISLPEQPKPQLSPAIELPKDSGPESEIKVTPSPTQAPAQAVTPTPAT